MKKYLILENIRSAYNVGAMFRTAEGAGVSKIFLCGYTPTPTDRFGRTQEEIKKTSLGASEIVPWEKSDECIIVVQKLQQENVQVIAVEQTDQSIPIKELKAIDSVAYVMGNEVEGVSEAVLAAVDQVVFLPMLGQKESLNVSTAAGVVLYRDLI